LIQLCFIYLLLNAFIFKKIKAEESEEESEEEEEEEEEDNGDNDFVNFDENKMYHEIGANSEKKIVEIDVSNEKSKKPLKECSTDSIFDQMGSYLPEDYEEGKNLPIKRTVDNLEELISIVSRLQAYASNISQKVSPTMERFMPQIIKSSLYLTSDLEPECMFALAKIMKAVRKRQIWALKCDCEFHLKYKIKIKNLR
jgi:hypothetical protein